jgi:hypothetical protein
MLAYKIDCTGVYRENKYSKKQEAIPLSSLEASSRHLPAREGAQAASAPHFTRPRSYLKSTRQLLLLPQRQPELLPTAQAL